MVATDAAIVGLSPRGRGNRRYLAGHFAGAGSIPAWAGKPGLRDGRLPWPRVYPRVGGETCSASFTQPPALGLSPRGRGNRDDPLAGEVGQRSIPAWAGKPAAQPG